MIWLGVDTGGTFTDFVCFDEDGRVRVHKVLSTPEAPERAILQGIAELDLPLDRLQVVHGSTVATNAVLEGKGVRTVFVTNRGFADLLSIGRQARRALYDLRPVKRPPPVPSEDCLETGGRIGADGSVVEPLTDDDLAALRDALAERAPEAVAICLLFSWLRPELEQRLREVVPADCFVSLSSEVLPEVREYERGMATWLNAWALTRLRERAAAMLAPEGIVLERAEAVVSADLRYRGQSHTLNLPWTGAADTAAAFHSLHAERYGHALDQPVELVTLRLAVRGEGCGFRLPDWRADGRPDPRPVSVPGCGEVPLYRRETLPPGFAFAGPAIVAEQVATTWVAPGWRARVDDFGNLLLQRD